MQYRRGVGVIFARAAEVVWDAFDVGAHRHQRSVKQDNCRGKKHHHEHDRAAQLAALDARDVNVCVAAAALYLQFKATFLPPLTRSTGALRQQTCGNPACVATYPPHLVN